MNKKTYLIILLSSLAVLAVVVVLFFVLPKQEKQVVEKKSDDYLKNAEIFNFTLSEDEKEYYITGLKARHQNDNTIVIPETIDNIPVTKVIGDQENFYSWRLIKQIDISKNVYYIGCDIDDPGALNGGTYGSAIFIVEGANITSFNVSPENKTYTSNNGILFSKDMSVLIRYPNAKSGDAANLAFVVPDSVTTIYEDAFYKNQMLRSITLSDNVETIGDKTFYKCNNLRVVNMGSNVKTIGSSAFFECNLTNFDVSNNVTSIGIRTFGFNSELESVYIPSSVVSIGLNAFTNCPKVIIYTDSDNVDKLKNMEALKGLNIVVK